MFEGPDKTNSVENHRFDDKRGRPNKLGVNAPLKPTSGHILVEPDFPPTETASGILLGEQRKTDIPNKGWIIEVADDIDDLKKGQYIVFQSYQAKGFWNMGVPNIPIERKDVLARIKENDR